MSIKHVIDKLVGLAVISQETFHKVYRERGISLKKDFDANRLDLPTAIRAPSELVPSEAFRDAVREHESDITAGFLELLQSPYSSLLLFHLHSAPAYGDESMLTKISPSLSATRKVVRGGPNIYKVNGWVVHVLIGYAVVAHYIPKGRLPPTVNWPTEVVDFVQDQLAKMHAELQYEHQVIVKVSMLGHDIGVAKAVPDHHRHGKPLVRNYLKDLGMNSETIRRELQISSYEDFVWAVESIVEFHAFLNRIGIEISIAQAKQELNELLNSVGRKSSTLR